MYWLQGMDCRASLAMTVLLNVMHFPSPPASQPPSVSASQRLSVSASQRGRDQKRWLHQALLRHRQRLALAHDDVVEHAHIHQRQSRLEGLGQVFVGAAGLHRAAGVVVAQDHSCGLVVQRTQYHFARVKRWFG